MSGETYITYGDITLRHCNTQSITQVPVLDPSGVDLLYWKFTVKVSGIVHGQSSWCQWAIPTYPANPGGNSGAQAMIGLRIGLPPRKAFKMFVGRPVSGPDTSEELLRADPVSGSVAPTTLTNCDVKSGPLCTEFVITKISGGDIYNVDATFELHKVECSFNGQAEENTTGILSNRWSATDSIDQNRRLVRSYTGTLIFAANIYNPNMFRGILVPPLQSRMRRENITFTVSEDGLSMRYTFTDTQIAQSAPYPCSHWDLTLAHSAGLARIIRKEVSGLLVCPDDKGTAADLLALAWYLIGAKIHDKTWNDPGLQVNSALLESIAFSEHIGEKTSLSFSATFQVTQKTDFAADFDQKMVGYIGLPLRDALLPANAANYSPFQSDGGRFSEATGVERPYIQGAVPLASMFLTYLQSCCSDFHSLTNESTTFPDDTNESSRYQPTTSIPVYTSPTLPAEDTSYFTENAKTYAYTAWKMSSTIRNDQLKAAMPIAKQAVGTSGPPVDSTKVVKLSLPQARRIVRIEAERVGKWPEMPDLETLAGFSASDAGAGYAGPTQHLLEMKQLYALPVVAVTGQEVFTVGIEATYALTRAPRSDEFIPVGRSIWNTDGAKFTTIEATKAPAWSS